MHGWRRRGAGASCSRIAVEKRDWRGRGAREGQGRGSCAIDGGAARARSAGRGLGLRDRRRRGRGARAGPSSRGARARGAGEEGGRGGARTGRTARALRIDGGWARLVALGMAERGDAVESAPTETAERCWRKNVVKSDGWRREREALWRWCGGGGPMRGGGTWAGPSVGNFAKTLGVCNVGA